jgi:uncharacterized protein YjiS (DUF1127 family)
MASIKFITKKLAARRRYREVVRELSRMRDHELCDIGIHRCDIESIARQTVAAWSGNALAETTTKTGLTIHVATTPPAPAGIVFCDSPQASLRVFLYCDRIRNPSLFIFKPDNFGHDFLVLNVDGLEVGTHPIKDGVNSRTVCQPIVMMLARRSRADETNTIGPGSR